MNGRVTLLTDFGDRDGYVGAMKGVVLKRAATAHVADLAHDVPPGDIRHAAYVIGSVFRHWPAGTIHVVAVDPGVGTDRRAVALACHDMVFVGPDNGAFTEILAEVVDDAVIAVELGNEAFYNHPVSATFHGRDIFASCAGYMAAGVPVAAMGYPLEPESLVRLPVPSLDVEGARVRGEIITTDRFGNAISNIRREQVEALGDSLKVTVGGTTIAGLSLTFGNVTEGQALAYLGSADHLEIAINRGNAAETLRLAAGAEVLVERA